MSKIHITLVGGQAAPIYNAIVAISPDKVVFICSDTKECRRSMEAVKHEIAVPGEAKFISPTNPREILSLARQLAKQYADEQVVLNISGGLKSWSHLFGIVFQAEPNATVVYMDQNNVLWNYKTMTGSQNFAFDMHTHFRLYGNSIENHYKRLDDYTEKDDQAVKIIENVRGFNIIAFNDLLSLLTKKNQNILQNNKSGRFEHSSGSYVEWRKRQGEQDELVSICLYNKKGVCLQKEIESPNAVELAFNSGWFEYKVARMLCQWPRAKEICLNCRFPFRQNVDKNEVDILVNTGSKVLFVECKTQITNNTDIDKFRSVVKGYGGMGSKGLFVTEAKMTDIAKQKCEEHGILTFSLKNIPSDICPQKALHRLLENELFNINTK